MPPRDSVLDRRVPARVARDARADRRRRGVRGPRGGRVRRAVPFLGREEPGRVHGSRAGDDGLHPRERRAPRVRPSRVGPAAASRRAGRARDRLLQPLRGPEHRLADRPPALPSRLRGARVPRPSRGDASRARHAAPPRGALVLGGLHRRDRHRRNAEHAPLGDGAPRPAALRGARSRRNRAAFRPRAGAGEGRGDGRGCGGRRLLRGGRADVLLRSLREAGPLAVHAHRGRGHRGGRRRGVGADRRKRRPHGELRMGAPPRAARAPHGRRDAGHRPSPRDPGGARPLVPRLRASALLPSVPRERVSGRGPSRGAALPERARRHGIPRPARRVGGAARGPRVGRRRDAGARGRDR